MEMRRRWEQVAGQADCLQEIRLRVNVPATVSPDCKLELLENIEILKQKGYHGMLITDHDSYKAYRYYKKLSQKPEDFVVLKGRSACRLSLWICRP